MIKGEPGYIQHTKKKNLRYALIGLSIMIVLYFTGLILFGNNGSQWTFVAAMAALPSAQFLARYYSLKPYESLTDSAVTRIKSAAKGTLVYELALVIGKDTCYAQCLNVHQDQLLVWSEDPKLTGLRVENLLKKKGILLTTILYTDLDHFIDGCNENANEGNAATEAISQLLIGNAL